MLIVLLLAVASLTSGDTPAATRSCGPLAGRAVAQLTGFTTWLRDNHVRGVIGEVGWPTFSSRSWDRVAGTWLRTAVADGLGVYVWGAAEQWDPTYPLAVYRTAPDGTLVAGTQAPLVEGAGAYAVRGSGVGALHGVALSGPSFGASLDEESTYAAGRSGLRGRDYAYPSTHFLEQLSARGITSVRLAVMWERLQPNLFGPLAVDELAELRRVLAVADRLGMSVVLDLHNYGRYALPSSTGRRVLLVGSPDLPASALADLWRRVASALRGSPALAAYGIMNEPHDLPGGAVGWEATTREVVAAVREVDSSTLVLVPGYAWSAAGSWRRNHPAPWVRDPAVAYEAHQYFDHDGSGRYELPFGDEEARAGTGSCTA